MNARGKTFPLLSMPQKKSLKKATPAFSLKTLLPNDARLQKLFVFFVVQLMINLRDSRNPLSVIPRFENRNCFHKQVDR